MTLSANDTNPLIRILERDVADNLDAGFRAYVTTSIGEGIFTYIEKGIMLLESRVHESKGETRSQWTEWVYIDLNTYKGPIGMQFYKSELFDDESNFSRFLPRGSSNPRTYWVKGSQHP